MTKKPRVNVDSLRMEESEFDRIMRGALQVKTAPKKRKAKTKRATKKPK